MKVPRLKEWRESRGETQVSLAEKAGVTQFTVLRAEHGENMRPSTARRLAEELGITVSDLQKEPPVPHGFAMATAGKAEAPETGQRGHKDMFTKVIGEAWEVFGEPFATRVFYWSPHDGDYEVALDGAKDALLGMREHLEEHGLGGRYRLALTDDGGAMRVAVSLPRDLPSDAWERLGLANVWSPEEAEDLA